MSTWNRAPLLMQGLDSIFAQNYEPLEVVVVDDGSEDNTKEICSFYPVKYIYLEANGWGGQSRAMNVGIKNAHYPLMIMQSPEIVHLTSNTIERLLSVIKNDDRLWAVAAVTRQQENPFLPPIEADRSPAAFFLSALWRHQLLNIRGLWLKVQFKV